MQLLHKKNGIVSLNGYYAYNNGGAGGGYTAESINEIRYDSPKAALAILNDGREGENEYDWVQKWETSREEDALARASAKQSIDAGYDPLTNNCMHTIDAALEAASVNHICPWKSWFVGLGFAWCPPQRFFTTNLVFFNLIGL